MLRLLAAGDLSDAIALLERATLASGVQNIGRYLRWQPDGCWGWFDGGLAGMVTVLRQGHVGFVGCMAVEPAQQGRGLGRRLLEHAQTHSPGVATFLLEATPVGELLYRKLGYVVEHDSSIMAKPAAPGGDAAPIAAADRAAIVALDREAAGCARDVMIAGLADEFAGATVRRDTELAGYGLVVGDRLGPVVARDAGIGRALIERLAAPCTNATVGRDHAAALDALAAAGFVELRRLKRMRLGPAVPARRDWIWTYASAGAG